MDTKVFDQKYKNLNERQREAVDTIYGPVMVVAGPGTGKTTVLTLRIANILLKTDAKPDEILALTFTDSGVQAMRQKLREVVGDVSFRINIFTFHGFANHMRALYPECFEKIGGRMPCDESDQIEIIEEILDRNSFKELRVSTFGLKIRDISKRISELKRENISIEELGKYIEREKSDFKEWQSGIEKMNKTRETEIEKRQKYITRLSEFKKVFSEYESLLEERSLYDYDDTILGLIDALTKHTYMLQEMRETFQFVLADEHQDANGSQNAILQFFKDEELGDEPNLFIVGDDKQSIFRFQGASLENFFAFENDFPKAKKVMLENNYRSHRVILDLAHSLISHDGRSHTKLQSFTSYDEKNIDINEFDSYDSEMQYTAREIETILKKTKDTDTIAVLARNNMTLKELARYLEALSIPYSLAGDESLFETFEYKKVSALFDAILDPMNSPRLIETLFFGYFKLPINDVFLLEEKAKRERRTVGSIFIKDREIENDVENNVEFLSARNKCTDLMTKARKLPLLDFLKELQSELNLFESEEGFDVFRLLFEEAGRLVLKKRNVMLMDFVLYLKRLEHHHIPLSISQKENSARVKLSSIHKSKGLEYDFVFIIDITDKRFEKQSKKNDSIRIPGIGIDKELDEERRLLYVAITRAKRHVSLSYSLHGQKDEATIPSVLIDEIDPQLSQKNKNPEFIKIDTVSKPSITRESKDVLREVFLKRSFSVTALNNFLECPFRYLFRNLLLIPGVPEFNALLGTACHNALERFHREIKKGNTPSKKDIKDFIYKSVELQPFAQSEIELAHQKAEEYVLAYIASFNTPRDDEKLFIEEGLSFPLLVPHSKEDFEITINGKIDLAILSGGTVEVIDFKSKKAVSRNAIMGKTSSDDGKMLRQLQFYKFLWEHSREDERVNLASLVFISPKQGRITKEVFELEENDKETIKDLTIETLKKIYNFEFLEEGCGDTNCEFCKMAQIFKI